jgi:hypothetical protein
VRYSYEQEFFRITEYSNNIQKAGCDLLHVKTGEDYKSAATILLSRNKQK